ncbi:hypothetical protein [Micromonospora sp. HK10]|uniref:hypothetical protein n=1 Tax=Micromonospora sp. HK10 TaxID=1538294 RepID=UPI001E3AC8FA|nr:hypothetical protein [Micromonospora sp. HK10]
MILAVLLAGAGLGTGLASWFAPTSSERPRDRPKGDAEGPFAERQASVNRSHIPTKQLAEFAAPWLARMGDCTGDTQSGGPERGDGEQTRTRCTAGIVTVYWISYRSIADRDAAQARYAAQGRTHNIWLPACCNPARRPRNTLRSFTSSTPTECPPESTPDRRWPHCGGAIPRSLSPAS